MSDIDALADTVRDTLPPRGVTSIPVKRTKSAVANAAHAALDDLVATAKAAEARVAELEGALAGLLPWAGRQTFETDACWVIARDTLAAPDTTDCRHVDNGPSWWWRL